MNWHMQSIPLFRNFLLESVVTIKLSYYRKVRTSNLTLCWSCHNTPLTLWHRALQPLARYPPRKPRGFWIPSKKEWRRKNKNTVTFPLPQHWPPVGKIPHLVLLLLVTLDFWHNTESPNEWEGCGYKILKGSDVGCMIELGTRMCPDSKVTCVFRDNGCIFSFSFQIQSLNPQVLCTEFCSGRFVAFQTGKFHLRLHHRLYCSLCFSCGTAPEICTQVLIFYKGIVDISCNHLFES